MKPLYRIVLQKLRIYLRDNLLVNDELIDELYSTFSISTSDKELIDYEKCNRDKLKRMLVSLSDKDDKTYDTFKECLLRTKNEHVFDKIKEEESLCLSELSNLEDTTKELISKFFHTDTAETFTSHKDIEDVLINDHDSRTGSFAFDVILDPEWLKNVVVSTFPNAKEGFRSNRGKKKKKKRNKSSQQSDIGYFGIVEIFDKECKRERQESECSQCSDIDSIDVNDIFETEVGPKRCEKYALSVEDFYLWVKGVLEEHSGGVEAAEDMRKDAIDSAVFENLTPEELASYFPKLGQRKKVKMMWEEQRMKLSGGMDFDETPSGHQKTENQKEFQHLRQFESPATYKDKYKKGSYISDIEMRKGNPLIPVHKFVGVKTKSVNTTGIAIEVVKFGAACMNDRTNGTVHFGIKHDGKIEGYPVDKKKVERSITKMIRQSFYEGQVSIALNCIRPPQFIEVIGEEIEPMNLFVIEIDVVSSSKFVEDFAFFLKEPEENQSQCHLYRYDGDIKQLDYRELELFMKQEKNKLFLERKEFESKVSGNLPQNRNKRLQDFLCCGEEYFEQTIYPILLLHDMHSGEKGELNFTKFISWRAIFDFNKDRSSGSSQRYLEDYGLVFNTNFIEEFDQKKVDRNQVDQVVENLRTTSLPNWIYCNGSDKDCEDDATDWKMNRSQSFRKAIDFHVEISRQSKIRVLIPVFGSDSKFLIDAAEEFFIKSQGKCLVITESEALSSNLREQLHKRNVFPQKSNIDDFFVIGLPWKQVSEAVCRFLPAAVNADELEVTRSTDIPVKIPLKFKRELCDLEILAANECSAIKGMSEDEKDAHRRTNGENFYRGGTVSWSNFYFSDVLVRDVHRDLEDYVRNVVKGDFKDNNFVPHVVIYHQPGAGGSTTSRHLLWTMRDRYRCCVVKSVTRQTAEQINRFRLFEEDNPDNAKPVLVLIDQDEEENIVRLKDELISQSQKYSCEVFCVLINCFRVYELPPTGVGSSVLLKQHLTDPELEWFRDKYKELAESYKHNKGCDPNTLLSLNLMKENFKMDGIAKLVRLYLRDPNLTTEHRTLLKYLAFLNHYDINFQPVPVCSFDPIMGKTSWLCHLPQSFKVLISQININGANGLIPCIRIANYLLSKTVLLELSNESGKPSSTIGEVASELLGSKIINPHDTSAQNKKFEKILADIIKKRGFQQSGEKSKQFSPLIMELLDRKDHDKAIDIIDKIYAITDDPMVAQQLARLHMEFGNWEDAHRSIEQAMKQMHNHAYLTHTCGQVYKKEFESMCKGGENCSDDQRIIQIVQTAQKSQFHFRKSQQISRSENVTPQNPAGFDGEIRLSIEVLNTLRLQDVVEVCENNNHIMPLIGNSFPDCICMFMKNLRKNAFDAIQILQTDIYTMRKNYFPLQNDSFLNMLANGKLESYKDKLDRAWYKSKQEKIDVKPTIQSLIDAMHAKENTLLQTTEGLKRHPIETLSNIRIFLASSLELYLRNSDSFDIDTERVLKLSRSLFEMLPEANPTCILEAHLMIVALHWPLESKAPFRDWLCPHSLLIKALSSWQNIAGEKPSKQKNVDKVIFFISKVNKFPCLIRADKITKDNIATLKGRICSSGLEFEITPYAYRTGNIPVIRIPALNQINMACLWHKEMDVVIGFGLYGPKADLLENMASFSNSLHSPRSINVAEGLSNQKYHNRNPNRSGVINKEKKQYPASRNMNSFRPGQYFGYNRYQANIQPHPPMFLQAPPPYPYMPMPLARNGEWNPHQQQQMIPRRSNSYYHQTDYRPRPR